MRAVFPARVVSLGMSWCVIPKTLVNETENNLEQIEFQGIPVLGNTYDLLVFMVQGKSVARDEFSLVICDDRKSPWKALSQMEFLEAKMHCNTGL
jgi:hypothetical protein